MHRSQAVIFINPPGPRLLYRSMVCTFISKARYIWQPQDLVNLSAQIPQEYDLSFIDCSINGLKEEYVYDAIRSSDPVLVIVAISSLTFAHDVDFLKRLKKNFPKIKTLVIGDVLLEEVFWDEVLNCATGIILNSLDVDLLTYIKTGATSSKNLILKSSRSDHSLRGPSCSKTPKKVSIGIPRHEVFINKKYRFPFAKSFTYSTVTTQFGCPFHCAYCSQSRLPVSYRAHEEVLQEIERVAKLGVRDIFFGDPSFGFPKDNAEALLKGMIKKRLSIQWCCYANPQLLDESMLTLMKMSGCHTLIIGIDDEDLGMLKERYKRELSAGRLAEFCNVCHRLGMKVCADFIIGLNEEKKAVDRMVELAKRLKLDFASFNIHTILLGSIERADLVARGELAIHAIGCDTSGAIGKSDGRLVQLRNAAVKKFYLRPEYLFRRITSIRGLAEFAIQFEEMLVMLHNIGQSSCREKDR